MWGRYAWARVSPLNSIETTSVSTMAAFIVGWLVRFLLDATRADLRRIPLPTRLQASVLPAEFQSRQWVSRPVERPVPRRKAGGVLRSRRLDSLCSLVHESRITGHRPLALRHHGLVSCPAFTRSTLCQIGASSTPSYSSRQTYLLVASSINSRAEIVGALAAASNLPQGLSFSRNRWSLAKARPPMRLIPEREPATAFVPRRNQRPARPTAPFPALLSVQRLSVRWHCSSS